MTHLISSLTELASKSLVPWKYHSTMPLLLNIVNKSNILEEFFLKKKFKVIFKVNTTHPRFWVVSTLRQRSFNFIDNFIEF